MRNAFMQSLGSLLLIYLSYPHGMFGALIRVLFIHLSSLTCTTHGSIVAKMSSPCSYSCNICIMCIFHDISDPTLIEFLTFASDFVHYVINNPMLFDSLACIQL